MKKLIFISILLIVGCEQTVEPLTKHGCLDSQACNYDSDAAIDNNSCEYVIGCDGVCGSGLVIDECNICGGENSACSRCVIITTSSNCGTSTSSSCIENLTQEECNSYFQEYSCVDDHNCGSICNGKTADFEQGSCENYDGN